MSTKAVGYELPKLFRRITSHHNQTTQHFIKLREKKLYRRESRTVLIQGSKTIRELSQQGFKLRSLAVTVKKEIKDESEIKQPSLDVIQNPSSYPADKYFVTDINLARRILGTASKPGNHELFAEIPIPDPYTDDDVIANNDKLLVFDKVNDPGNVGTLIRTAKALGWQSGLVTSGTCDLYNDKTVRASRALTMSWPHLLVQMPDLMHFLSKHGFTPVIADMMPSSKSEEVWSPEYKTEARPGTGVWFWNFGNKPRQIPRKMALILSSEHGGVNGNPLLANEIRVSVPMNSKVESLNVANAGSIIMNELNRVMNPK
jgi:tRNA G18 (ribose-2'-O)-methylase SpoU